MYNNCVNSAFDLTFGQVDKILQQRKRKGVLEYLVRWRGYGAENDSWEPGKNLKDCAEKIKAFNDNEKANTVCFVCL